MKKIYEKSSGGIVYRKNGKKVYVLLLEWINSKGKKEYVFPKWHIEPWETALQAAIREVSEETWLQKEDLQLIKFITKLRYTFVASYIHPHLLIEKDVYMFLIKYNGADQPSVQKEERFVWYKWVPFERIRYFQIKFDLIDIIQKNKVYFI